MRRFSPGLVCLLAAFGLVFGASSSSVAGTVWSLANDFSLAANDNTSTWSYQLENSDGSFTGPLLTTNTFTANQLWGTNFPSPPTMWSDATNYWGIGRNDTGVTQTATSNGVGWTAGEILLHPKFTFGNTQFPGRLVVSWLAPSNTTVNVGYSFSSATGAGNGVGLRIVHNSTILQDFYNPGLGGALDTISNISVSAGDRLNFIYDTWADAGNDITRTGITIQEINRAAGVLFSESFNGFTAPPANFNGGQFETNLDLAFSGSLPGWTATGAGAVHAVDHTNVTGNVVNPRDFAPMIFGGNASGEENVLTLDDPIAGSNEPGQEYNVSFLASPAVYQVGSQATGATDGLLIEVLRSSDDTVLSAFTCLPGAWPGGPSSFNLQPFSFQYFGDGSGDIYFRIGPGGTTALSGHFDGAIDNLVLTAIPEPSTFVLFATGLLGLLACAWRKWV